MIILGVDEVGRGCWAGPVVAAAVILKRPIKGLKDSKKCTKLQRERLAALVQKRALTIGVGWVGPADIDELGLTAAVRAAMQRAVDQIKIEYDELIIDGNYNFLPKNVKAKAVIKADDSVPAVSAASIVAKVARDKFMTEQALAYPNYGFEKHVGYGTAFHVAALRQLGVTPHHRQSFKPIQALTDL